MFNFIVSTLNTRYLSGTYLECSRTLGAEVTTVTTSPSSKLSLSTPPILTLQARRGLPPLLPQSSREMIIPTLYGDTSIDMVGDGCGDGWMDGWMDVVMMCEVVC